MKKLIGLVLLGLILSCSSDDEGLTERLSNEDCKYLVNTIPPKTVKQ
jgi:hypothetical protein